MTPTITLHTTWIIGLSFAPRPLMRKSAAEVAVGLATKVFPYWGFLKYCSLTMAGSLYMKSSKKQWPGQVAIINGRPRHSQSQGLVENGNHCVEMQIKAMKQEWSGTGNAPWTDWLQHYSYY